MTVLNGQMLLNTASAGLTGVYAALMSSKTSTGTGLTLKDLSNLTPQTMMNIGSNYSFLQYMQTHFKDLDKDGDGMITGADLENTMKTMQSKGLTYNEIQQLCTSGNCDKTLMSTVLTYFNKIDSDGDGRITSSEITKFSFDSQKDSAEAKYKSYRASGASLYYNDGVEDDTSSVLDALRPDLKGSAS